MCVHVCKCEGASPSHSIQPNENQIVKPKLKLKYAEILDKIYKTNKAHFLWGGGWGNIWGLGVDIPGLPPTPTSCIPDYKLCPDFRMKEWQSGCKV